MRPAPASSPPSTATHLPAVETGASMSPKSSYPAEAAVAMQATPDSSAVAFQIQYRNLAGHHRTLDDVCADQLVGSQLKRIASKEGLIWEEAAATLRLVKAGKELDRSAPCGLEKGDSVHLLLRSLPGGMDGAAHWQVWGKPIAPLPSPTPSIPHPLTPHPLSLTAPASACCSWCQHQHPRRCRGPRRPLSPAKRVCVRSAAMLHRTS